VEHDPGSAVPVGAQSFIAMILSRRSIRDDFVERPVERHALEQIVRCGLAAPSSKNARPWRLHVVSNRATLRTVADLVDAAEGIDGYVPHDPRSGKPGQEWVSTVRESAEVLRQVSVGIFIENCGAFGGGKRVLAAAKRERLLGALEGYTFEVIGIGAAIQNMWIGAHALGVAGAFMGDVVIAEDAIRSCLSIDGDLIGVLALGYSDAAPPAAPPPSNAPNGNRVVWFS
jgi:nitroreductase